MASGITPGTSNIGGALPSSVLSKGATSPGILPKAPEVTTTPVTTGDQNEVRGAETATTSLLPGVSQSETENGSITSAGNGLKYATAGNQAVISLPTGDAIEFDGEKLTGKAADGNFQVTPHASGEAVDGFSYERKDGTDVYIDLNHMSVTYQSADGSVLQGVDAEGRHWIKASNEFKGPNGIETLQNEFFINPDGTIASEQKEGFQVSNNGFRFQGPNGHWFEKEFVVPFEGRLQGPLTGEKPSVQLPPPTVENFNPETGSLLNETVAANLTNTGAAVAEQQPPVEAPVVQFEPANTPSGLQRHTDGTHLFTQLRNGVSMKDGPTGAFAFDLRNPTSPQVAVEVTPHQTPDGKVERQYRFPDKDGNIYTMFSHSQDISVESPDGRVGQILFPDGTMFAGVRGDNGKVYRMEVSPNGAATTEPGMSPVTYPPLPDINAVTVPVDGKPTAVPLPLPVDNDFRHSSTFPLWNTGTPPLSGSVPEQIKGLAPGAVDAYSAAPTPTSALDAYAAGPTPPSIPLGVDPSALASAPPPPPGKGPDDVYHGDPDRPPTPEELQGGTVFPQPGVPQQPIKPSFWNRLKFLFTGDPKHVGGSQPGYGYGAQPGYGANYDPNQAGQFPGQRYDYGNPYPFPGGGGPGGPGGPGVPGYGYGGGGGLDPRMAGAMVAAGQMQTSMMGVMSIMSSMSPWGMGMFFNPFMMF